MTDKSQKRLWIDTDITIGDKASPLSYCDVDDGYALGVLFRSPEVLICGISSTLGNTQDIEESTAKAQQFVSRFGPTSLQVYKGSAAPLANDTALSQTPVAAVNALAAALEEGPMTVLAIGALTNIAMLALLRPDLVSNISELIIVAGRQSQSEHFISGHHQPKPFRDLNFETDTLAFEVLAKHQVALTMVPFAACKDVWLKPHDIARLELANRLGRYLASHSLGWLAEWELVFGANGFNPFDMVAAAYVINPSWFSVKQWQYEVQYGPSDTSKGEDKAYLICNGQVQSGLSANYCVESTPAVQTTCMERLCRHEIAPFVLGMSHINVIVEDVDIAADFYQRVLGFERAVDHDGAAMDYRGVTMEAFAVDAGLPQDQVNVDVLFVKHPEAGIFLELMRYHAPHGTEQLPKQPKTYDLGGPRHIALEVSNCNAVFRYLKDQEGVTMINPDKDYHPVKLDGFPISFFYWIDKYGIQWEMEEGRQVGAARGIV